MELRRLKANMEKIKSMVTGKKARDRIHQEDSHMDVVEKG